MTSVGDLNELEKIFAEIMSARHDDSLHLVKEIRKVQGFF